MMEASIHAVLLIATPVTVMALVWRLPSRAPGGMQLLGASACAAAGVLGANLFNLHMCSEGIAVAQWLFLAPCILALAFVDSRAWRRNLAGGVVLAMVGLSCHYTEVVHHSGWTGNPASDGGSHALAQSFVRYAAEEIGSDASVEDAVLPAEWLRESPAWAAVERVFRRGRFVRRRCGVAWHTPFTGLIPYEEFPQDFWFPGGSLKRDLHRLELRDRPENDGTPESISVTPSVLHNWRIPIVYSRRITRDAVLTDEQVREIATALPERWSEGLARWFIHARAVWKDDFAATVYFKWDFESPRIRRGTCMLVVSRAAGSTAASAGEILKALGGTGGTDYPTARYCQVSPKGSDFTGDDAPPPLALLPFRDPEGFTDAEIVAIVDFVRSNPRTRVADVGKGVDKPAAIARTIERADSRMPILEIRRNGGIIEVKTGSLEGPLSGAGEILRIRAIESGGYELLEIALWFS